MALLPDIAVTRRFRVPARAVTARPVPAHATQLVVVIAPSWNAWRARLLRYERTPGQPWKPVGDAVPVVLGHAGYGWGDGLHGAGAPAGHEGPLKREGDGRSPAGVFALGIVHGYATAPPAALTLPYRQATARERCVDDPGSPSYNRVVSLGVVRESWKSAELMRRADDMYELALDIEHNRSPVVPGHGSCIFAHAWAGPEMPVTGCTGLSKPELARLITWLKPETSAWVALPQTEYETLRNDWDLPQISPASEL
jgi:D-alanyl-D-alanine dipeptidase